MVGRGIGGGDAAERCGADVSEFFPRRPGRGGGQCALLHGAVFGLRWQHFRCVGVYAAQHGRNQAEAGGEGITF